MLTGFPQISPDIRDSCLGLSPTQQGWKGLKTYELLKWTIKAKGKMKGMPHHDLMGPLDLSEMTQSKRAHDDHVPVSCEASHQAAGLVQ